MEPSSSAGYTVAITGVAGYIGTRLTEALAADPSVSRILGFDVTPPRVSPEKLIYDRVDVRDPALAARLAGVDALVHLAFVMDPIRDESKMRDINVAGSENVFRSAATAGVRKIVYTSSATVYGAHPDNPIPLAEDAPLRANLDFSYPAHKLEVEYVLKEMKEEFPDLLVTTFRPAIVFGSNVDNAWSHVMELPAMFAIRDHHPPFQFVHEDDVADALAFAVRNDLDGVYNLAPDSWTEWHDVIEAVGKPVITLSQQRAFALQSKLWASGLGEAPAGMLHYVMYPWVLSPQRLVDAGFRCRYSSDEALDATLDSISGTIRLGPRRFDRAHLKKGLLVGAGALGGLALVRRLSRQRAQAA